MGTLYVYKKVYLSAGHHRQPRNADSTDTVESATIPNATGIDDTAESQILFGPAGKQTTANFLFWSATDGSTGDVQTDPHLPKSFTGDYTATAWYFPQGGGPGSAIIDDAFSVAKGDFIDDTFVTVTSDPSLTSQANVVGIVPTASAETLKANASVPSTGESFNQWLSFDAGTVDASSKDTLDVPAGAGGLAFAVYKSSGTHPVNPPINLEIVAIIIAGIINDGPGWEIVGGVIHHIGPWGPLVDSLIKLSAATGAANNVSPALGAQVLRAAAVQALASIRSALPSIEKAAEGAQG